MHYLPKPFECHYLNFDEVIDFPHFVHLKEY